MAAASFSNFSSLSFSLPSKPHCSYHNRSSLPSLTLITRRAKQSPNLFSSNLTCSAPIFSPTHLLRPPKTTIFSVGDGGGSIGHGGGGGGGGGGGWDGEEEGREHNKEEALLVLAQVGRSLDSLPADLAAAIKAGRVPGSIVRRFFDLEKSAVFRWLLNFGGFKERLLADDLFLAKVAMECGVGIFTKTAAELERRKENFSKELDFVLADVVMAIVADFMLVWLPAPTVSLRPPLAVSAGSIAKFFHGCPENAFQVALAGTSYSLLQRIGAIVRNGAKLFAVGTGASLVGTGVTNALINARKAVDKSFAAEAEDVPIISTSVAYGVYMAVSSNLRYQILAGIIEQRILEPLLHQQKLILSAVCFAVRTGNTFLGSLLWVDYARWVGVQKIRD
ncbi:protein RETICULATA-RELATED 4, chloroplastic-like [Prosopis cineraria]|uniref:protein RETICULATA-RELATED 4, chloroplastic-like n=1 Tax=Prosopis cineraria TaxID=364024 RepID=UPI00240FCDE0|nr:protein RETICULATA-RELATED 4, chloroplastic-like [Prosopis cineraria]XP_054814646.1 protein RETICULATA-RELATED 4, chloroplastic-like [Prosopis cineraria]